MVDMRATNAASSGVEIDPRRLRALMVKRDAPGLRYLTVWALAAGAAVWAVGASAGSPWQWFWMFVLGTVITVPAYALSHECAHGTFLKTRWLNTIVNWFTSLIYFEEPNHRFAAHMRHHNFTWLNGLDAQMPYTTPLTLWGWLREVSGLDYLVYEIGILARNASGRHGHEIERYTPARERPVLKRGARVFIGLYAVAATLVAYFGVWPEALTYFVIPRLMGGVSMQLFTIIQHAEMAENQHDLRRSCRSFTTNGLARFLYAEMNHHVEHHLFPKVPFHALADLQAELGEQLPTPERGLIATNWRLFRTVLARSLAPRTTRLPST